MTSSRTPSDARLGATVPGRRSNSRTRRIPRRSFYGRSEHSTRYPETAGLMERAADAYTAEVHQESFDAIFAFLQTGQVTGLRGDV